MPSKSNTGDEPPRRSARFQATLVVDEDGKARSEENSNKNKAADTDAPAIIVQEEGQELNQDEVDAFNAHLNSGGCTEIVDPTAWKDYATVEHADFHNKMLKLKDTINTKLSEEEMELYIDVIESYEHAMRTDLKQEMDKKEATGSSSDNKHESVVATAGANAHMAAITAGKSEYSADASMANAMGKQEENYLAKLMARREELEMEIDAAKKTAVGYHANELIATAKDVSEEAAAKAEKITTRGRISEAEQRKQEAKAIEDALKDGSSSVPTGGVAIPAHLAMTIPDKVASIAADLGFELQVSEKPEKKTKAKNKMSEKARGKLPMGADDDEDMNDSDANDSDDSDDGKQKKQQQLGIMAGSTKKRAKKRDRANEEDEEAPKEKKKRTVDPNKITASQHYSALGIKNASQLGEIVEKLNDAKSMADDYTQCSNKLSKLERQAEAWTQKESAMKQSYAEMAKRYNLAMAYLMKDCGIEKKVLIDKGIGIPRSKK